jgi:hypothetical protein
MITQYNVESILTKTYLVDLISKGRFYILGNDNTSVSFKYRNNKQVLITDLPYFISDKLK